MKRLLMVAGLVGGLAVLVGPAVPRTHAAPVYDDLVVVGDSLSDVGNIQRVTLGLVPSRPYFQGRFSNGPVWVEWLGAGLGLDASTPALAGGHNYAFGGARTGLEGGGHELCELGICQWGMLRQTAGHLERHRPSGNELFVVWGGPNDYFSGDRDPRASVGRLTAQIAALAQAGGRHFLVPNLPALDLTPRYRGSDEESLLRELVGRHNTLLDGALDALEHLAPELTIHRLNVAEMARQVIAHPVRVGFTNVTDRL